MTTRIDPALTTRSDHARADRSLWDSAVAVGSATLHEAAAKELAALGWINHPVSMSAVRVNPGDLIVGDRDGVVAIPQTQAAAAVAAAKRREQQKADIIQQLGSGETTLEIYGWTVP